MRALAQALTAIRLSVAHYLLPRYRLTLLLKSGNRFSFTCATYERTEQGDSLTGLKATVAHRFPLFISLGDVEAITVRRTWL